MEPKQILPLCLRVDQELMEMKYSILLRFPKLEPHQLRTPLFVGCKGYNQRILSPTNRVLYSCDD